MSLKLSVRDGGVDIHFGPNLIGTISAIVTKTETIEGVPDAQTICGAINSADGTLLTGFVLPVTKPEFIPAEPVSVSPIVLPQLKDK